MSIHAQGVQVACQGCTGGTPIRSLPPSQAQRSRETLLIKLDAYIIGLVWGLMDWQFINF